MGDVGMCWGLPICSPSGPYMTTPVGGPLLLLWHPPQEEGGPGQGEEECHRPPYPPCLGNTQTSMCLGRRNRS